MSKLEELIQQYCPDGVEYVPLSSIADLSRGKVISKDYIKDNGGDYPVYSSQSENEGILGRINSYMYDGKYLTWTTDGAYAGTIFRRLGKFNITNVCGLVKVNTPNVSMDFLYYWLYVEAPKYVYRGMGNPKLMSNVMGAISVPVPPLPVQEEIVRILDTFTELQAELQAELQKRLQQYNYYRDNLLSFEGRTDVQWKKLNEVATVYDGTHQTPAYKESGIPFISVENIGNIYNSRKYISREDFDKYKIKPRMGDVFMTRIGSIGVCAVFEKQADIAYYVSLALIRPNQDAVNSRYLKHIIESLTGCKELRKRTLVNAVPIKVNKDDIGKIVLPFPSLAEQQKIVSILDRFDSLTNDLTEGLPAEIEKRRLQYEYYRDKLLTFKRK